jgi:methylenetetrahydrofolate dehydrogenase (NADP+)/methenyltetrahydrofolate cyclohydrolase
MIIDGKKIAEEILVGLEPAFANAGIKLGVVLCGGNAATASYVRIKTKVAAHLGVQVLARELPPDATTEILAQAVRELSATTNALIVQLPLPASVDLDAIFSAIPPEKDIDALNSRSTFVAPVALAVLEILQRTGVDPKNKKVAVVGQGRLVGVPVAKALADAGAYIKVYTEGDSLDSLRDADIVVSGVGKRELIQPAMLKKDVVLIDAGTSDIGSLPADRQSTVAGDAAAACASVASVFTPVPGGVGPIAIALLFQNLARTKDSPL